jgi:hypothetical protein
MVPVSKIMEYIEGVGLLMGMQNRFLPVAVQRSRNHIIFYSVLVYHILLHQETIRHVSCNKLN